MTNMDNNKRRKKGPEHISDILRDASKEWAQARIRSHEESDRFKDLQASTSGLPIQIFFLYIENDPEYIRMIYLN